MFGLNVTAPQPKTFSGSCTTLLLIIIALILVGSSEKSQTALPPVKPNWPGMIATGDDQTISPQFWMRE